MLVYLKCCSFFFQLYIIKVNKMSCNSTAHLTYLEVHMFVRNKSHVNDVTSFIALMSEKTVVVNHKSDGSWFVYPGCRQTEGTYAFCGEEEDYEPLLAMLRSCGKDVTISYE